MAKFKIPKHLLSGFQILIDLSDESIKELTQIISAFPVGTGPNEFENRLRLTDTTIDIHVLAETLYSFGALLTSHEATVSGIAEDLSESYSSQQVGTSENTGLLKSRLIQIFDHSTPLKTTFKAANLLTENERLYRDARIISDIRLIFNDDLADKNRKAVLIHRLKLTYNKGNDSKDFYVNLDSSDLQNLKEQIERAQMKEQQLTSDYNKTIEFVKITD